jgi:HAD superfamily hydrolase (TIGR01509 family)
MKEPGRETSGESMLIIFDCDGVLIDSEILAARAEAEAITALGLPTTAEELCRRFAGAPTREVWVTLEAELGRPLPTGFMEHHLAEVRALFARELQPIAGVREAVAGLTVPYCVASSTRLPSLVANLGTAGLIDLFAPAVFSASQVKRPKPAPDVYLYAASQMGADPTDCLVVEDSVFGVEAARRAGMRVIGFLGGAHVGPGLGERLLAAGAERLLTTMRGLSASIAAAAEVD